MLDPFFTFEPQIIYPFCKGSCISNCFINTLSRTFNSTKYYALLRMASAVEDQYILPSSLAFSMSASLIAAVVMETDEGRMNDLLMSRKSCYRALDE